MDYGSALDILKRNCDKPWQDQEKEKGLIITAFRVFWKSNPSEVVFCAHTDGINLWPEMLYIMAKEEQED